MSTPDTGIYFDSCSDALPKIPDESIDCVVTSPPYAQQRAEQYGGISESDYPRWTVEYMSQIRRVLKPHGNVAIVIRPNVWKGQLSDYVLRTRLALRDDGWNECDELIWVKPNSPPLGHKFRPRRSWESILWFSLQPQPYCDPKANGVESQRASFVGNGSTKGLYSWVNGVSEAKPGTARSPDYVSIGVSNNNKDPENNHPAQYPEELAEWLIRMLCPEDGTVLDPFLGSGTTAVSAINTGRSYVGIEQNREYQRIIEKRILQARESLELVS